MKQCESWKVRSDQSWFTLWTYEKGIGKNGKQQIQIDCDVIIINIITVLYYYKTFLHVWDWVLYFFKSIMSCNHWRCCSRTNSFLEKKDKLESLACFNNEVNGCCHFGNSLLFTRPKFPEGSAGIKAVARPGFSWTNTAHFFDKAASCR